MAEGNLEEGHREGITGPMHLAADGKRRSERASQQSSAPGSSSPRSGRRGRRSLIPRNHMDLAEIELPH